MRFVDIAGNIIQPVSNEELVLCEKIRAAGLMLRGRLDERERELAVELAGDAAQEGLKVEPILNDARP